MNRHLALIVEDEADLATIFSAALEAAGFETETLADGHAALDRLAVIVPDVVVLDLHLPGADGAEILHHIRADERLARTRVMIASADAVMAESLDLDADLVLLKPISFTQLRELAGRLLPPDEAAAGE